MICIRGMRPWMPWPSESGEANALTKQRNPMTNRDELPALLGGRPVRPHGPPDWPMPDEDVLQALQSAYKDGSWGKYQGIYVERLEKQLAQYLRLEFVATCGSGTFAIELALRALKVGAG